MATQEIVLRNTYKMRSDSAKLRKNHFQHFSTVCPVCHPSTEPRVQTDICRSMPTF